MDVMLPDVDSNQGHGDYLSRSYPWQVATFTPDVPGADRLKLTAPQLTPDSRYPGVNSSTSTLDVEVH